MKSLSGEHRRRASKGACWLVGATALSLLWAPLAGAETWQEAVGYIKLKNALGAKTPTGVNVRISMVEGPGAGGSYLPNVDEPNHQFDGLLTPGMNPQNPLLEDRVKINPESGPPTNVYSSHATNLVGPIFFGDTFGLAPGADEVWNYEANHWLTNILRVGMGSTAPTAQNYLVQNSSWVGSYAAAVPPLPDLLQPTRPHLSNPDALRRYDYVVETANSGYGLTAVVGLNNDTNIMPWLLAQSYNAIAVGRTDGIHSTGRTQAIPQVGVGSPGDPGYIPPSVGSPGDPGYIPDAKEYGGGRSKPELVVPITATSGAAAAVSSAATILHQSAFASVSNTIPPIPTFSDANRNEVMKAVLLAGATKQEFPGWTHTPTQPLDDVYGAGELNVYNSYLVQLGGKFAGSTSGSGTPVGSYGWDYQNFKGQSGGGDVFYQFNVAEGSTASDLSIVLSWNLLVGDGTTGAFSSSTQLAPLDLRLYKAGESTSGEPDDSAEAFKRRSVSAVDNVEHIYLPVLDPGTYTLKVSGAAGWDYGLAWRMTTKRNLDQVSADFDEDGDVDGADFLAWQRNTGKLVNATHGQGDSDGDGDVDVDDLQSWKLGLMPIVPPPMAALRIASIPEPGALMLAAVALGLIGLAARAAGRRP